MCVTQKCSAVDACAKLAHYQWRHECVCLSIESRMGADLVFDWSGKTGILMSSIKNCTSKFCHVVIVWAGFALHVGNICVVGELYWLYHSLTSCSWCINLPIKSTVLQYFLLRLGTWSNKIALSNCCFVCVFYSAVCHGLYIDSRYGPNIYSTLLTNKCVFYVECLNITVLPTCTKALILIISYLHKDCWAISFIPYLHTVEA